MSLQQMLDQYSELSKRLGEENKNLKLQVEQLQKIVGSMPASEIASWSRMSYDEAVAFLKTIPEKKSGEKEPERCDSYWDGQQCELPADHATEKHHAVGHWWVVGKL